MLFPCETGIWKALPAIRSALARALVERRMSQRQIATLLSTTEASISHYVKGKRGSSILLGPKILVAIEQLADQISTQTISEVELVEDICDLCRKVRSSCAICDHPDTEKCRICTLIELD